MLTLVGCPLIHQVCTYALNNRLKIVYTVYSMMSSFRIVSFRFDLVNQTKTQICAVGHCYFKGVSFVVVVVFVMIKS